MLLLLHWRRNLSTRDGYAIPLFKLGQLSHPTFYLRDAMHSAVFATAMCLSVRLTHSGIVSKRRDCRRVNAIRNNDASIIISLPSNILVWEISSSFRNSKADRWRFMRYKMGWTLFRANFQFRCLSPSPFLPTVFIWVFGIVGLVYQYL